jgi:hypothetical protein
MGVKAAGAAAIAWLVVQPMPGVADQYPYFAPLGAVVALSSTVAGSVRESVQGVVAILIGAALALVARPLPLPEGVALAVVVLAGTVLGGWRRIGSMASWIPISAMYVLILGGSDPVDYLIGYAGLTSLGALIGIGVNLALPPLPLAPTQRTVTRLRCTIADRLEALAEGLLDEGPPSEEGWDERQRAIRPVSTEMRRMVEHAHEAQRANWRAQRWQDLADRQYARARAMEELAFLVEDVSDMVADHERSDRERVALGADLRPHAAHAMQGMARGLRATDRELVDADLFADANDALDRLVVAVRERRHDEGEDLFVASAIITTLHRALAALAPDDVHDQLSTSR